MSDNNHSQGVPFGTGSQASPQAPAGLGHSVSIPNARACITDTLYSELSFSFDCTRVWEAWSLGTMSKHDFLPLEDRVDEIADSIINALLPELREIIAAEINIGNRYETADRILAAIAKVEQSHV